MAATAFPMTTLLVLMSLASWPQWGGPQRNFIVADEGYDARVDFEQIDEAWRLPLGLGQSGICVHGDTVFTMFHQDGLEQVIAAAAEDGQLRWRRTFPLEDTEGLDLEYGAGPHSTPLLVDGRLVCVGLTGRLLALDAETGRTLWQRQLWEDGAATRLERGFAASPLAVGDHVVIPVGGRDRSIRCYRLDDGRLEWQRHDYVSAYASPVLTTFGNEPQIVQLMDQHLVGLSAATGELRWEHEVPTERYVNCTSPVVGLDGWIYINTCDGLCGLQVRRQRSGWTVREAWASPVTICQTTNFVLHDQVLYGSQEGGVFVAVDALTGKTLWRDRAIRDGSTLLLGELLVVLQERGELAIARASRQELRPLWRRQVLQRYAWTPPVVDAGRLFIRDETQLIAYRLPSRSR
ncbi:MAG: PQQ-binding-like beta-propeller repeat protein [Planctomycetota bacterium]